MQKNSLSSTRTQVPHLGPLEQKVMQIFWKYPCSTVKSVQKQLEKNGHELAYTTVMTIMTRLVEKGALNRELEGKKYCYKPAQTKQKFVQTLIQKTMKSFVNRFGEDAVVAFLDEVEKLSPNEKLHLVEKLKK